MRPLVLSLGCVFASACGAKSALETGPVLVRLDASPPDSSVPDSGVDAMIPDARPDTALPDVGLLDVGPPDVPIDAGPPPISVFCEPTLIATRPRTEVRFGARVEGDPPAETRWELNGPPESMFVANVISDAEVFLQVDVEGEYLAVFTAVGSDGAEYRCDTRIVVNNGEPIVECPTGELLVLHGETLELFAPSADDDGIVASEWSITGQPPRSTSRVEPLAIDLANFLAGAGVDSAGPHVVTVTVFDTDMASASCELTVRVLHPPVLDCPGPFMVPTRQTQRISVNGRDDTAIVEHQWTLISSPAPDADLALRPMTNRAQVRPSRQGPYTVEYRAIDSDGLVSGCLVTVIGTPTPPELMCPDRVETTPLTDTAISVSAIDDGIDLRYRWQLVESPTGSSTGPPRPDAATTSFRPDVAGEYIVRVEVRDEDGMTDSCDIVVAANADEGLRVEMSWDTGNTDMDLHLLHPMASRWNSDLDCYYLNCDSSSGLVLDWFTPSTVDNPRLDLDDTRGFGPENINIDVPAPATYTVGVHAFSGQGTVTIRVYCGGSRTTPRAEFTARVSDNSGGGERDLWRVADVTLNPGGACTVRDRRSPSGQPDIISDREMNMGR